MKRKAIAAVFCTAALVILSACGAAYPDNLVSADNAVAFISSEDVRAIEADTAYGGIITQLGATQDAGWSEEPAAVYLVDGTDFLYLTYANLKDKCPLSGVELLESLQSAVGIRGEVTDVSMSGGELTMLVEASGSDYGMYDKASVRVDADSVVVTQDGETAAMERIRQGDTVEVVFGGPVAESYPVQGKALRVMIMQISTP